MAAHKMRQQEQRALLSYKEIVSRREYWGDVPSWEHLPIPTNRLFGPLCHKVSCDLVSP